jgi:hypothetical protein
MNLFAKFVVWIVLSVLAAFGAKAQAVAQDVSSHDVQAAKLLICGTAEKAQHFAAQNQDVQAAIANDDAVNGKSAAGASSACLVAGIAYVSGKQIERVQSKDGSYDVTEILIVGVATPYGMLRVKPSVVYTLLKVNEERA